MRRPTPFVLAVVAAALAAACASVVDLEEVRYEAPADDPVWGCLGRVTAQAEDPASPVDTRFRFVDLTGAPIADVSAKLCKLLDIGCQTPLAGSPFVSDADGWITLPLHLGFRGYLDIVPSDPASDLLPTIIYLPILDANRAKDPTLFATLGSTVQLAFITGQAGRPADSALGHIGFVAYDCRGAPAADVSVHTEPSNAEEYPFYFDANGTPSITQATTSTAGTGGIVNVNAGVVALVYERRGQRVGSQNVIVRAGGFSYVAADPTP